MEATTIIPVLFVLILAVIGLRFAFASFFRPYILFRLEVIARRVASKLWFSAYKSEDRENQERLYSISSEIESYATTIRENRIVLQDFDWCMKKVNDMKKDVELQKNLTEFSELPNNKRLYAVGNILLVFLIVFALAARFPLTLGLIFLNVSLVLFLVFQWNKVSVYFSYSFIETGDAVLQSIPT